MAPTPSAGMAQAQRRTAPPHALGIPMTAALRRKAGATP